MKKVYCKNCKWLKFLPGDLQYGILSEFRCKKIIEKKRDWYNEYNKYQSAEILNKDNNCFYYELNWWEKFFKTIFWQKQL